MIELRLNYSLKVTRSTYYKIASTISVPADSTLSFLEGLGPLWLDETDLLAVTASANSDLVAMASWEEMKDA